MTPTEPYYFGLMPSPDGKYAATESLDWLALTGDILLLDMAAGNPSRLTFVNYSVGNPVWSSDSHRVLFTQWMDHLDVISVQGGTAEQIPFPGGRKLRLSIRLVARWSESLALEKHTGNSIGSLDSSNVWGPQTPSVSEYIGQRVRRPDFA